MNEFLFIVDKLNPIYATTDSAIYMTSLFGDMNGPFRAGIPFSGSHAFEPENKIGNPVNQVNGLSLLKTGYPFKLFKSDPAFLQKSSFDISTHVLPYNVVTITFDNALMDFLSTTGIQYAFKRDNVDEKWIYSGLMQSAIYTGMSPGEYIFKVKASNNDIVRTENGMAEKLLISPPWWRNWYVYLLFGLLIFTGLYFIRRYELNRLKLRTQLELERIDSDALRKMNLVKSRFFANISHEFRTPLTLILGQIESLMSSDLDIREKAKLQVADKNSHRLLMLINQLLDLSKLEAGNMGLSASQHNIVPFLKSLFFSFESWAAQKNITLQFESDTENLPVVFDPDMMEKIFNNLFSNALKFTLVQGEVKVKIQLIDSFYFEIIISDTGPGIPEVQLMNIFDRFYQVDNSGTRRHDGTGIGLALCKELVELHHGTIIADSREGEGMVFIIRLPFGEVKSEDASDRNPFENYISSSVVFKADKDIELLASQMAPVYESDTGREIILIVEDNRDVRTYIREQLEPEYLVTEAANGEEGILNARETIPDLILTDLMMPKMDGYLFSKEIRMDERTSHIPLIMVTARAGSEDKIEGLETGIDEYIIKPFSSRELKVRIRNLINQRILLRKRFSRSTLISPSRVTDKSIDQVFLGKVVDVIESHFEDQHFTIESLAGEMNMSVSQLNRKLKALIDQPAGQLMRSLCLQRAADLLKNKAGTVAGICYKLGFNDQAYFSRAFKKQFGCSPSEYMNLTEHSVT